jgi:nitroreductase
VDAYLAIVSKREVRSLDGSALPEDAVRRILEAGRVAGSSRNRQARRFVVVREPGLVARVAETVWASDNLRGAPLVVAVVVRGKGPLAFDAGRAAQNMMLAAHAEGIGSCPNGIADPEGLAAILGHAEDEQVVTVLGFGRPATPRDPARRSDSEWVAAAARLPYDEVVEELSSPSP